MIDRPPTLGELAVQATTSTRRGYDLLAPRFESTAYATPEWLIESCRRRVDRLYPLDRDTSVGADLACGTGRASLVLQRSCRRIDGYDFSPGMLAQARSKADPRNFCFHEADLATLDLPPQRYDRIATFGAWGHILPQWRTRLVHQIVSALRPGGVFYTVTADPAGPGSARWWRAALFDSAIKARNALLGDPFHMYYLLNDTLTVKGLFEHRESCQVRLEPVPGSPHRELTLLMAYRNPAAS